MIPITTMKSRRCASSSKTVAILSLWSKRAIIAPNNLIDSQHYKRHKKILRMTEFHSPSLSILIITQSNVSFLKNYSKMIPRLVESFRNLHLFHSNATKTRSKLTSNLALSNVRAVKITDRFTCTSANVIYCITCTLCNKLYIGETGRRLGDRFRELRRITRMHR